MSTWYISLFCILSFISNQAFAGAVITYHGRIVDNNNRPVESNMVTFKIRVLSPNPGKCLLYEESRDINMKDSGGVFVIPIGDGGGSRTSVDPGLQIEKIFSNDPNKKFSAQDNPKIVCNSTSEYAPQVLDQRQLVVSFDDHSGVGEQTLPIMDINFVPLAVNAHDAQNIGGTPADSVLRLSSGSASPLTPANFMELLSLINGSSNQYEKPGKLNGSNLPALANGQVLGWNGGWSAITPMTSFTEADPSVKAFAKATLPTCGANSFLKDDGNGNLACASVTGASGGTVTSVTAGTGLKNITNPGNPITDAGSLAVDVGTNANQIIQMGADSKLPVMDGSKLTNVTATSLSNTASINTSGSITSPQINTRNLYIENATPNRVTLQAPTTFSDYTWVLPSSQGGSGQVLGMSSTAGQLEWKTPAAVVTESALNAGNIWVGDTNNKAAAVPVSGDISLANNGATTLTKIRGKDVDTTLPTAVGQVLLWDSSKWTAQYVRMQDIRNSWGGTQMMPSSACSAKQSMVWSVITDAFTCQSIGSLDASAITTGTISSSVLPANATRWQDGAAGAVYYNGGNVGIGTTSPAGNLHVNGGASTIIAERNEVTNASARLLLQKSRGTPGAPAAVASGDVVGSLAFEAYNASGAYSVADTGAEATIMAQVTGSAADVNNMGTKLIFSTKSDGSTTNSERMTIASSGNVGIGTSSPKVALDVSGHKDAIRLPAGTTAERPATPANGDIRYNSTTAKLEAYVSGQWITVVGGGSNGLRDCNTGNPNDVMVAVGSWCVDRYEASVWSSADGSGTGYFTNSTTNADSDPYYPTGAANVPAGCNRNGAGCTQFAVSKPGVIPSRGVTWYQAAKFCANAGKVMIPDDIWQVAAIGTVDPDSGTGTGGSNGGAAADGAAAKCNINNPVTPASSGWTYPATGVRPTAKAGATAGGANACVSDYGVEDMVGNLWEWTSMNSIEVGTDTGGFTQGKNNASGGPFATADGTWNVNGSAWGCDGDGATKGTCGWKNNTPAAALRGGVWNDGTRAGVTALNLNHSGSSSGWAIGFRCARPR